MSEVHGPWDFPRSFSADSLIDSMSIHSADDNNKGVLQTQCNQVFIGMVTMQYQARQVSYKNKFKTFQLLRSSYYGYTRFNYIIYLIFWFDRMSRFCL